jgi:biopolymer transport protein ExbD
MPIKTPGPRLGHSVPFKHLGGKGHGKKGVYAALNLTAMVDMMTMLVVFLLSTFSASGEILMSQKGVELPTALNDKDLDRAPIITISADTIAFKGEPVADPRAIMDDTGTEQRIVELADKLALEHDALAREDIPEEKKALLRGLLVLQADKAVPTKVLNRIMKTAASCCGRPEEGYNNIMFAINRKAKGK